MRSTAAWVAILVLGGVGVFFWQRSQIASLRAQVAAQGAALADNQERLGDLSLALKGPAGGWTAAPAFAAAPVRASHVRQAEYDGAVLRADERRVILGQYRDVLAQLNLPEATAARLQDLLTDRIEAFLDAQDAAMRVGFAQGSAGMERAVALAIADDDREISEILGSDASRRLSRLSSAAPIDPSVAPAPAAAPVVVTVVMQAPPAPSFDDSSAQPAASYSPDTYAPYYFPSSGFFVAGGLARPFGGARPGILRPHRSPVAPRLHRS